MLTSLSLSLFIPAPFALHSFPLSTPPSVSVPLPPYLFLPTPFSSLLLPSSSPPFLLTFFFLSFPSSSFPRPLCSFSPFLANQFWPFCVALVFVPFISSVLKVLVVFSVSHPPTYTHMHTHTHKHKILGKLGGKWDSTGIHSIKLEITTLIENKKMERKKLLSLCINLTSEFTHNKFQKVC